MTQILNGKTLAQTLYQDILSPQVTVLQKQNITPALAVFLVGNNPASQVYVRQKIRAAEKQNIQVNVHTYPVDCTQTRLLSDIQKQNQNRDTHGIIVQLPLPPHIDPHTVIQTITPAKDVDGFTPHNRGCLAQNLPALRPCTPQGIITLLQANNIELTGKHVVIIGRSNIVGGPLSTLMTHHNATVTLCHSHTTDVAKHTRDADIIVCAIGKPHFLTADMVADGAIIVDVGISRAEDGLLGDVDFDHVSKKASAITPVPGGVGPMTVYTLLANTVQAAQNQNT